MSKSLSLEIFNDKKVAARLAAMNPLGASEADRAYRVLVAQVKTPALAKCTPNSLLLAACNVAKLGLNPDPQLGHVYLVPFGNQATVIVGYKGFVELARRSGKVDEVEVELVYEKDEFEYEIRTNETHLRHRPAVFEKDRGKLLGGYAYIRFIESGRRQYHVVSAHEIEKAHKVSRASSRGPWVDHVEAMQRKTVARRGAAFWPLSAELARAADLDYRADEDKPQGREEDLEDVLDAEVLDEGTTKIGASPEKEMT